jgi:VanZ family protein
LNVEVFNYISLDPTNPFTIEGENVEHNGDLKYAITNGYSGKITVNFTKESTFKDVTFVSSDTSIASINSDGTITPHKAGKTNITVTCDDGHQNKIEFTIELEVKRQDYIKDLSAFFYKVRKSLDHFSAFLVLGIFSTFTWLLYFDRKKLLFSIPVNYFLGYFIAALTEFIQLYVPGRYGSYADVKLDFEGFCLSATILTIFLIIHNIRKHIFDKKRNI